VLGSIRRKGEIMQKLWCGLLVWAGLLIAWPAAAQISAGTLRFSVDTDVLSIAGIQTEPDGTNIEQESTVFGFGPNHQSTGLALGFGYALDERMIVGGRVGFGYDVTSVDGVDDRARQLNLALMPSFTFVPMGESTKLYVSGNPIFEVRRTKQGDSKVRTILGGFSVGVGALIFTSSALSFDVGFHFEGRFGGYDSGRNEGDLRDLRGVVRAGLSLWK
jgi:hypothetical protein